MLFGRVYNENIRKKRFQFIRVAQYNQQCSVRLRVREVQLFSQTNVLLNNSIDKSLAHDK